MSTTALRQRGDIFGTDLWQSQAIAEEPSKVFSEHLGRKQPMFGTGSGPPDAGGRSYQWVLWTVNDLDADLNLHASSVDAKLAPAPVWEVVLGEGVRGWSAGWEVRHGRHKDLLLICMTDSRPGHLYLKINDHVIPVGVSPAAGPRSSSLSECALADLSAAFRVRLLSTVLLAAEIAVSAPTILSISTAF